MILKTERTLQINSGEIPLQEEVFYKTLVETGLYKNSKKCVISDDLEEYYGMIEFVEKALVYYYKILRKKNLISFNFVLHNNKSSAVILEFFEQSFRAIFNLVQTKERERE